MHEPLKRKDVERYKALIKVWGLRKCVCATSLFFCSIAGVRVGRVNGTLMTSSSFADRDEANLNIVVSCSRDAIVMIEAGGAQMTAGNTVDALMFAHTEAQALLDLQTKMQPACGMTERIVELPVTDNALAAGFRRKLCGKTRTGVAVAGTWRC